jgi:hypothetical protein
MNRPYLFFIVLSLIIVGLISPSQQLLTRDKFSNEIRITSQKEDGKKYHTFTGEVYLQTSLASVKSILTDNDSCLRWMDQCKESKILRSNANQTTGYVYFIYNSPKLPWYLFMVPKPKHREMVLKVNLIEDIASGKLIFNLTDINPQEEPDLEGVNIPSNPSLVTISDLSINWEIKSVEDNYLHVTLRVYSDPNHEGPDLGIIERSTSRMVKRSLQNLRDLIDESRS